MYKDSQNLVKTKQNKNKNMMKKMGKINEQTFH